MALTTYTVTDEWDASARYTASDETDVLLANNGNYVLAFTITDSDTVPSHNVGQAMPLMPGRTQGMTLKYGERLWLASRVHGLTVSASVLD